MTVWDESTGESFDLPVWNGPLEVSWDGRGVFRLDYGEGLAASDDDRVRIVLVTNTNAETTFVRTVEYDADGSARTVDQANPRGGAS